MAPESPRKEMDNLNNPHKMSAYPKEHVEATKDALGGTNATRIKQLTDQVHAERGEDVKEKVQRHWKNLEDVCSTIKSIISTRESLQTNDNVNLLSSRMANPICKVNGFPDGMIEKDRINNVELSLVKSNIIPAIEKLPPYTSWVYVARCV
ncbi:hypothetical protein Fmac_029416 [Flemingia macrophylla]|uniref:Uncharacterized protein n=1 Tax=Flemingia macrophylla TaxID=520843 RepID=A0ABD1LAA2_9FABA